MQAGLLKFETFQTPVQVLGTVSEYSHTWLWSWANSESNIPDGLLTAALQLQEKGRALELSELVEPEFDVDPFHKGHALAMAATGVLGAAAYYRGPYEGGAVFLLIPSLQMPEPNMATQTLRSPPISRTSSARTSATIAPPSRHTRVRRDIP